MHWCSQEFPSNHTLAGFYQLSALSDTAHPAVRTVAASDRPRIAGSVIRRSPAPSLYLLNAAECPSRTRSTSSAPTYEATSSTWRSLPRPTSSPNIQTTSFQSRGIQCYVEIGIVGEEAASYDPLCCSLLWLSPGMIVRSSYCGAVLTANLSAHCITLHALPTRWSVFWTTLNSTW